VPNIVETGRRWLTLQTHHIRSLPVVVLLPHQGCDCRCVMCDIWQANADGLELASDDLARHLPSLQALRVRWVVLSGGEALLHRNLWEFCRLLRQVDVRITLLSTGMSLARHAPDVVRWTDDVIVSLDGPRDVHDEIRRIPKAYDRLAAGVGALAAVDSAFRVTARSVVQRRNHSRLVETVDAARSMGLHGISFLAADVTSTAFNRPEGWGPDRVADVGLDRDEVAALDREVGRLLRLRAADVASGFIAESEDGLRRIVRHFAARIGDVTPPPVRCNAPWVSTVIESDGAVRPCFFHPAIGNIHERPLAEILNGDEAVAFRRNLDVTADPVCRHCTCSLEIGPRAAVDTRGPVP
jgi:Fe-coproporphyrin III synthase